MKKVLVTGGVGFIGLNMCRKLLNEGNEVICLDNLYNSSRDRLALLKCHEKFSFLEHDVRTPFFVQCDQILHLACPASPVSYQSDPVYTIETSVLGARNVLELAKQTGAKVLLASTSEVYGQPTVHPQPESYNGNVDPTGPRACYDEGKRVAECLFFDYHRVHNVDIKVIRIFNTYGPFMELNDGRVVSNLIVQALRGEHLSIYGDGTQTRSFQYIKDLLSGIDKLMNTDQNGVLGPINLGNPDEITINQLASIILKLIGNPDLKINYSALPVHDPVQRKPDISLAKKNLNWTPKVNIESGLIQTIDYFRKLI